MMMAYRVYMRIRVGSATNQSLLLITDYSDSMQPDLVDLHIHVWMTEIAHSAWDCITLGKDVQHVVNELDI